MLGNCRAGQNHAERGSGPSGHPCPFGHYSLSLQARGQLSNVHVRLSLQLGWSKYLAFYVLAVRKWCVQSITTLALCLSLHTGQQARQGALLVSMHVNSSAAGPGSTNEHPLSPLEMQRRNCWRANRIATGNRRQQHTHSIMSNSSEDWRQQPPYALEQGASHRPAKWQGSCFCGGVKFEAFDDPKDNKVCHCVQCQRMHGEHLCKPQKLGPEHLISLRLHAVPSASCQAL